MNCPSIFSAQEIVKKNLWQMENNFCWSHKTGHGIGKGATVLHAAACLLQFIPTIGCTLEEMYCRLLGNGVFTYLTKCLAAESQVNFFSDNSSSWNGCEHTKRRLWLLVYHKGNAEEDINGYVVFKWISMDQLGNRMVVRRGGVTPPLSAAGFLKVHKIEIFFCFDFEICNISLLVMSKY
jgi:hypothetical protein